MPLFQTFEVLFADTLYSWTTRYTPTLYVDGCTQYMLIRDVPILCIVIGLIWYTSIMYDFNYTCNTSHPHPAACVHILGIPSNQIDASRVWIVTPRRLSWMSILDVLIRDNLNFSRLMKLYLICLLPSELVLRLLLRRLKNLRNILTPVSICSIHQNTPALEHRKN